MRTTSCLAALLLTATSVIAQGTAVALPGFSRTYSSASGTRGMVFQAPVAFNIVGVQVPDETGAGVQNVEIYILDAKPPLWTGTVTPTASELRFTAYGAPVTGTPLATGTIPVAPGKWVVVLGACGTSTMHNSYAGVNTFQTSIFGATTTIERTGTQTNINTNNGPNVLWTENAAISRVELYVTPDPSFIVPPELVAVAEAIPGAGTLGTDGGTFRDNEFLRYGFNDPTGGNAGLLIWNALNVGIGGSAPIGMTAQIPGLQQVWAGSTPAGTAVLWGPSTVGSPDPIIPIPAGLFSLGDTVRMQGLVLDGRVSNPLPINPTLNTIEFRHTDCILEEGFDNLATGIGNYPTNWTNGGGTQEWQVNTGGTTSANTGPTAAASGTNYVYCETSVSGTGPFTYIMNTDTYASNTFVNNTLNFELSRVGATINVLEVRMDDGSGTFSTLLATYTGPEPSGQEWTAESIALPTPLPANVQFQFSYTRGTSFSGDIAIDSFCVR